MQIASNVVTVPLVVLKFVSRNVRSSLLFGMLINFEGQASATKLEYPSIMMKLCGCTGRFHVVDGLISVSLNIV